MTCESDATGTEDAYLLLMDALAARCLRPDEDPYVVACEAMGVLTQHLETGEYAGRLYSIWGELSDRVEVGDPDRARAAPHETRRFAREWLEVRQGDHRLEEFVHRWYYQECGYADAPDSKP